MAQKIVKKISVKIGGTTYKLIDGAPNAGKSVDDVDVTDFNDEERIRVPHPQPAPGNIALVIADDGTAEPPVTGVVGDYIFETTYFDGTTASPAVTKSIKGYLGSADAATIQVSGERRPVWNCEFRKCGQSATTTTPA